MTQSADQLEEPPGKRICSARKVNLILLFLYSVLLAGGLLGMHELRNWALRTYDTTGAQENWTQWQQETERQSRGDGPVTRRKAKSDEPPALVLARDYFLTLVVIFVLLGTVLFATIALMIRGAISSPGSVLNDT